jgi:hypothetical protein
VLLMCSGTWPARQGWSCCQCLWWMVNWMCEYSIDRGVFTLAVAAGAVVAMSVWLHCFGWWTADCTQIMSLCNVQPCAFPGSALGGMCNWLSHSSVGGH